MKKKGFNILSQEIDSRYVEHHKKNLKLQSTSSKINDIKKKFDLVCMK